MVAAYKHHIVGSIRKERAGKDFIDLVGMLEKFVITVRFPQSSA